MSNIFEIATREAIRFTSVKGDLTTEQVWNLPLTSKSNFDLDTLAKGIHREIRAMEEESFVSVTRSPAKDTLELKLDILKHIIAVRQAENAAKVQQAANRAERDKLLAILAQKQEGALRDLSEEELQARLKALGG